VAAGVQNRHGDQDEVAPVQTDQSITTSTGTPSAMLATTRNSWASLSEQGSRPASSPATTSGQSTHAIGVALIPP
jgi:hypothetical protein